MRIAVLGAGIIGMTTAYYLARRGHKVTVIDRQGEPARECSFANGGQLSYSHVEPWAIPSVLSKLPGWLLDKDSPLVFRPGVDMGMYRWLWQFLRCCTTAKAKESSTHMWRLASYSKTQFETLQKEENLTFDYLQKGVLHVFANTPSLERNRQQAEFQKELGCPYTLLETRAACEAIEPALKNAPMPIIGGIHFPTDGSGDVFAFAHALYKRCTELDVTFHFHTEVMGLGTEGNEVTLVRTDKEVITADAYVLAQGAYSPRLLPELKTLLPIYPMKGYSISIPVDAKDVAPEVSLTDQSNKIVYSRFGNRLRVAGTAEFGGYNHAIYPGRIATLKRMVAKLFPHLAAKETVAEWACLRPQTPDGSPILGTSPYKNLYFNTGHGTLGWTLSCGSAAVLADVVEGKKPAIDLTGLTTERFIK